jgi:hypothetical protein
MTLDINFLKFSLAIVMPGGAEVYDIILIF